MATKKRLQLGLALVGLASTMLAVGCSSEDNPDTQDAASDAPSDSRTDQSVKNDATVDTKSDASDGGAGDARTDVRIDTTGDAAACLGPADAGFIDAAAGLALVTSLNCARCHQEEPVDAGIILSGRTTSSVADAGVYAKNLTPDPVNGLGCWSDQQIITAFMTGVDRDGTTLCRMPMFGNRVDGGAPQEIVNFLRSLPAVNKVIPETDPVCPPQVVTDAGADARDASPDAGPDVEPDATPDAAPDATVDVTPDAGAPDVTDAGAPDATDGGASDATDAGAPDAADDAADGNG